MISVMHLKHPETMPSPSPTPPLEKLTSTKPVPSVKRVGNHCREHVLPKRPLVGLHPRVLVSGGE